jgi:protease-4
MLTEEQINWERKTLKDLLDSGIKEKRAQRRWNIFFKILFFAYIGLISYSSFNVMSEFANPTEPFVAVINISGPIMSGTGANAENINPLIEAAFADTNSKAIILKINSPGGMPVQSNRIYIQLERFKKKYPEKKLYAVIEDVGASGAYWVACAADYIYADQASIVGSIGVIIKSFGFVDGMQKLGVERRVYSAGENKSFLDPFMSVKPEQEKIIAAQLTNLHNMFIDLVKTSRGKLLAEKDSQKIFSGEFWLGKEALELGLIDGLGDVKYVAQEIIGIEEIFEYSAKQSFLTKFTTQVMGSLRAMLASNTMF